MRHLSKVYLISIFFNIEHYNRDERKKTASNAFVAQFHIIDVMLLIQPAWSGTDVYTPGIPGTPHPAPYDVIPMATNRLFIRQISEPPESPYEVRCNNIN